MGYTVKTKAWLTTAGSVRKCQGLGLALGFVSGWTAHGDPTKTSVIQICFSPNLKLCISPWPWLYLTASKNYLEA